MTQDQEEIFTLPAPVAQLKSKLYVETNKISKLRPQLNLPELVHLNPAHLNLHLYSRPLHHLLSKAPPHSTPEYLLRYPLSLTKLKLT